MDYKTIAQSCAMQEDRYQFLTFTREDALKLGALLSEVAKRFEPGIAIAIEINGLRVFQYVAEGASKHNVDWIQRKVNTVNQFGKSSLRVWAEFGDASITMEEERLPMMDFAMGGGGFPLNIRGVGQVGVIAVSGLPHMDDHQVITDALAEFSAQKKK